MTASLQPLRAPLAGIPAEIHCAQDYEVLAAQFMAPGTLAYIAGGSGRDLTLAANRDAFAQWTIVPRLLHDVRLGHTRLQLAEQAWKHPLLLAPVAYQKLAHPLGEQATALAAEATETGMVCSTQSSLTLETVAEASNASKWFQLYFQAQREVTLDLIRRAEAAGFSALMLTLDAPVQVPSHQALKAGFQLGNDCVAANLAGYPAVAAPPLSPGESAIFQGAMSGAPTWSDLDWLLKQTRLPVWIKGVLHPEDAQQLMARGVAGLVVSNHGGRSLDGAPASLNVLAGIRAAVGADCPLLFDSGLRSGVDVFKALALGANAVMIGRLQVYALAVAGALGVAHMLKLLREELELCMALSGCPTLADIKPTSLLSNGNRSTNKEGPAC